jgi:type II secretory pathway pseudopilin PulG
MKFQGGEPRGARPGHSAGLGLVEAMIALAICAMLLTAVAAAFQGAADAVNENDEFFQATQTGRVALNRILTQVRRGSVDNASTGSSLHLITDTGTDVTYNYSSSTRLIQMVIHSNGIDTTYDLSRNVSDCQFQFQAGTDYAGNSCIARVSVLITVQVNNNQVLLSGTGTSRRNLAF